jgi:hypothetical protein
MNYLDCRVKIAVRGRFVQLLVGVSLLFIQKNPLARHSRAGGNPARKYTRRSRQNLDIAPLRGRSLINWIPAFAGMTSFVLMDNLGLFWNRRPCIGVRAVLAYRQF